MTHKFNPDIFFIFQRMLKNMQNDHWQQLKNLNDLLGLMSCIEAVIIIKLYLSKVQGI